MTDPQVPQFWHVSYPVEMQDGCSYFMGDIGHDEWHARALARLHSMKCGHATVTNREGLVATYVSGREWRAPTC